ncbi:Ribosome recycling factor [Mycoplasmopsis meleagridis]|uniref:Ribosome-recycling factor n=2 Tax=Mycoplasmopsis meleagridis TaxID=29561 RepID=A0A0F5H034_9BACT|nr:ribosome recycling factor [Mycoplasmopsis meleagridis]KKB26676.1 Ribosome recycling factor [Mycoplasmopsis meleagridis ATCC 25294]OAD18209.1 Ribosome recycling factor [Mycoplasmopsis meleagridis]
MYGGNQIMELEFYLLEFEEECEKALDHYVFELSKISTGRANPQIIKGIKINYYETLTPLEELSNISVPEPQQLLIKPYDSSITKEIVKAILLENFNLAVADEGNQIRLTFPALTTDKRKEMVKHLSKYTENAKIGIRNARHNVNKRIKADEQLSEDLEKRYLDEIQKVTDNKILHIEKITKEKENELMNA